MATMAKPPRLRILLLAVFLLTFSLNTFFPFLASKNLALADDLAPEVPLAKENEHDQDIATDPSSMDEVSSDSSGQSYVDPEGNSSLKDHSGTSGGVGIGEIQEDVLLVNKGGAEQPMSQDPSENSDPLSGTPGSAENSNDESIAASEAEHQENAQSIENLISQSGSVEQGSSQDHDIVDPFQQKLEHEISQEEVPEVEPLQQTLQNEIPQEEIPQQKVEPDAESTPPQEEIPQQKVEPEPENTQQQQQQQQSPLGTRPSFGGGKFKSNLPPSATGLNPAEEAPSNPPEEITLSSILKEGEGEEGAGLGRPGKGSPFVGAVRKYVRKYDQILEDHYYLASFVQATVLGVLGDVLAQFIEGKHLQKSTQGGSWFNRKRTFDMGVLCMLIDGGATPLYYDGLELISEERTLPIVALKTFIGSAVWGPISNGVFLLGVPLMRHGLRVAEHFSGRAWVRQLTVATVRDFQSWWWPILDAISFGFLPKHWRPLFGYAANVGIIATAGLLVPFLRGLWVP
mmetsp:Transcript_8098/g.12925  ORF Transcript_8098/g.12925 Transcript_8098/m.12925 type:complete len:514 (+) Transcript_8098:62-1603(+)